jgi:phage I-like protein
MSAASATAILHLALNAGADGGVPDWVHLLPAGMVRTVDGRGPYRVRDAAKLIAESLQGGGGKLAIDENHATDLAAPKGGPSPARGWIVELEQRDDGVWGRVEWTEAGRALVAEGAYRGISPVILHGKDGTITGLLRAALTNVPNLRGLAALHQREDVHMDLTKLRTALGLAADADEAAILATCNKLTSLQSALAPIAKAAGLAEGADATAICAAVTTLATKAGSGDAVAALQAELATVAGKLNTLNVERATERATAFVDAAIKAGRVGVKPLREHYIARHAADPAGVEKEINAFPILGPSGTHVTPPADKDGKPGLNDGDQRVVALMGLDPEAVRKTRAAEAATEEAL